MSFYGLIATRYAFAPPRRLSDGYTFQAVAAPFPLVCTWQPEYVQFWHYRTTRFMVAMWEDRP
jgi:hypothetical protein